MVVVLYVSSPSISSRFLGRIREHKQFSAVKHLEIETFWQTWRKVVQFFSRYQIGRKQQRIMCKNRSQGGDQRDTGLSTARLASAGATQAHIRTQPVQRQLLINVSRNGTLLHSLALSKYPFRQASLETCHYFSLLQIY